jgi:flavin reductase (DIM6/NTAB) family NADH-FMN oxidoreductase RutF
LSRIGSQGSTIVKHPRKNDFPVNQVRRYLEPGPIVLVSSKLGHKTNIMTLGWHTILEFSPSLVGLMVSSGNHSFHMIRESQQCVINLPTTALTNTVVRIGNTSGRQIDKFAEFGLTAEEASVVDAPLIRECHARFECQLHEDALVDRYNFFSSRWSRLTWQPRRNTRKRCTSPATEIHGVRKDHQPAGAVPTGDAWLAVLRSKYLPGERPRLAGMQTAA